MRPIAHNLVGIVGGRGQHRGPFRQTSHGLQMAQMRRKCSRQADQQRIIDTPWRQRNGLAAAFPPAG